MGKGHFKADSKRIEQYLSGIDKAQTVKQIADSIENMTKSSVYTTLQLMEVFGTVQKVSRRGNYYILKGVYDDEQISAMLPPVRVKPPPRRRRYIHRGGPRRPSSRKNFLEEHLSSLRTKASSGGELSALAMIGLNQIDVVGDDVPPAAEVILRHLDMEERTFETPRKIERFATVERLPKDARKLTLRQTKHLKEQLKELPEYWRIENYETAFAEFSALENGSYGSTLYFSWDTNPWEKVYRVTVDDSIPLEMKETVKRPRVKRRSKYDPMIDQFIELGQDLVEIDVEGKTPSYVKSQLRRRIEDRGLKVVASSAGGFVYLERKPGARVRS